jgi:hypothetical protein
MRLSVYFRAPLEIWMMKGACDWMQPREEAHGLLGVVDVVSAYAVLAVGMLEELRGGDDHGLSKK